MIKKIQMRLYGYIVMSIMILVFAGCASSNTQISESNKKAFEAIIAGEDFEIISESAEPQVTSAWISVANSGLLSPGNTAGQININGNVNYIRKKGELISAYLPFFGERQMGGGYGSSNTGIEFDAVPKDYQVFQGKKQDYKIQFNIVDKNHGSETYKVYIQFFPNLSCTTTIQSSHRYSIRYRGKISLVDEE